MPKKDLSCRERISQTALKTLRFLERRWELLEDEQDAIRHQLRSLLECQDADTFVEQLEQVLKGCRNFWKHEHVSRRHELQEQKTKQRLHKTAHQIQLAIRSMLQDLGRNLDDEGLYEDFMSGIHTKVLSLVGVPDQGIDPTAPTENLMDVYAAQAPYLVPKDQHPSDASPERSSHGSQRTPKQRYIGPKRKGKRRRYTRSQ